MPFLHRDEETMNHHFVPRGHEADEDDSSMPPLPSRPSNERPAAPSPPPPLGPEPSFQTQLLLSDMFSQQATLRNYDPGSIQAVMMALDEERIEKEQVGFFYEEASLALAQRMSCIDDDDDEEEDEAHAVFREHLSLDLPPPCPSPPHPALTSMWRDNSSSEESCSTSTDEARLMLQYNNDDNDNNQSQYPSLDELVGGDHIEDIMPLPPAALQQNAAYCYSSGSSSQEEKKRKSESRRIVNLVKQATSGALSSPIHDPLPDSYLESDAALAAALADCEKKMAAIPSPSSKSATPVKKDAPPPAPATRTTTTTTTTTTTKEKKSGGKKKKKKKKNRECLICQRTTAECQMDMRKLTCGHHFCSACIDRWLSTKDTCPYCRQQVKTPSQQQQQERTCSFGAVTA